MPVSVTRHPLLDAQALEQQAIYYGLAPNALEKLVAMDRSLRSMIAASDAAGFPNEIFGYALSGPAALLNVYVHAGVPLRLPDELTLTPVRRTLNTAPDEVARLIAATMPDGTSASEPSDVECYRIGYRGVKGPGSFLLRLERAPLSMPAPPEVTGAGLTEPGYMYDPRLCFRPNFSAPFAVPVAYAEEILLRTLRSLALWAKAGDPPARIDDRGARVDDLRLLVMREYEATERALRGPVRERLKELVPPERFEGWMAGFVSVLDNQIKKNSSIDAISPTLRPTGVPYTEEERIDFLERMSRLLDVLAKG